MNSLVYAYTALPRPFAIAAVILLALIMLGCCLHDLRDRDTTKPGETTMDQLSRRSR
jgi:hypothetical protein